MKKIPDFSKTIGIIKRGGFYSPSNEQSQEKLRALLTERGFLFPAVSLFDEVQMSVLRDQARQGGYRVIVHQRGLNR